METKKLWVFLVLFYISHVELACNANPLLESVIKEKLWIGTTEEVITIKRNAFDQLSSQYQKVSSIIRQIEDKTQYLENLLNLFSIVRRLTKVWPSMIALTRSTFGGFIKPVHFSIKGDQLWKSGVTGMVRIQEVYNISAETLASGGLAGAYPHTNLTDGDCFGIATFYYKLNHHERAVEWLQAALQRTSQDQSVSRQTILEYLHLAQCFKGDQKGFRNTHISLRQEFPAFSPSTELLVDYSTSANRSCTETADKIKKNPHDIDDPHFVLNTRGLCRKEAHKPPSDHRLLKCRLVHYNHFHLKIAPFKMEELVLDPPLLIFHDVIHEGEINHFIRSYHQKTRHAIADYNPNEDFYQDTQYNFWINDYVPDDPVARRIERRAARIANLDLYRAESTMLASYGLAGEIKMHKDVAKDDWIFNEPYSRADYLTVMYYMNDVAEGGYTIFPRLGRAVIPKKGAAVVWFNRYPDWSRIMTMEHSGCPILRGSKWIITKWFHVLGQDFPKCVPGREKTYKYFYL